MVRVAVNQGYQPGESMSLVQLSVKHSRTLPEAREQLDRVVDQAQRQFGAILHDVRWSEDRRAVKMSGTGFWVAMQVDDQEVHLEVDVPLLGGLLGSSVADKFRGLLEQNFPKRLT